ncbi:hypothetical protein [Hyalangium rubrum]|uniref:Tetratricopeptide repeat protein n=1 Tax=Hyalangium rubrum TaxID=3103134 RepID=A0ABU5HAD6_9BACT|nr:hypothetical protein [Hyalangium sp. s54d21]MDY7230438.1 hypothetical protein [Hyalangium sp. s54d21]
MRFAVLLFLGTMLAALPARAEMRGVTLYERGDYARARKALTDELKSPGLSKEDQAKARLYLAASLFALGVEDSARIQLEELAVVAPAFKVDPIIFPPNFVKMAEAARETVETQRKQKEAQLEAERQRLEAERKAREEAEARAKQPPPEVEEPAEEEASASLQLRPDVFGFVDPVGKSVGVGGGLTLGLGMVDLNARVLMGSSVGVGAEAGLLLGNGAVQPRLALRGTAVPGASAYGGGAVAGLRLSASNRLTFLVDVGAEYLAVEDKNQYRGFLLTTSAGVGFDLL